MTVFGTVVTGDMVEDATIAHLQNWLPTYLGELERVTGREPLSVQMPRSYSTVARFSHRPQEQLPAVIVVSPGIVGTPERRGDGSVSAWFRIEIGVLSAGRAGVVEDGGRLAKLYGAAVRVLMLQHPALGGIASATTLSGESYDVLPTDMVEVAQVALCLFDVQIPEIGNTDSGPTVPVTPPDVPGDWPVVSGSTITIDREELPV